MHAKSCTLSCRLQGHIRLALLPVVYNAMSAKETLRNMPLFTALDAAMRKSTYYPLLQRQSRVSAPELHPATAAASAAAATSNTMWSESASPWYAFFGHRAGSPSSALLFFPRCLFPFKASLQQRGIALLDPEQAKPLALLVMQIVSFCLLPLPTACKIRHARFLSWFHHEV